MTWAVFEDTRNLACPQGGSQFKNLAVIPKLLPPSKLTAYSFGLYFYTTDTIFAIAIVDLSEIFFAIDTKNVSCFKAYY